MAIFGDSFKITIKIAKYLFINSCQTFPTCKVLSIQMCSKRFQTFSNFFETLHVFGPLSCFFPISYWLFLLSRLVSNMDFRTQSIAFHAFKQHKRFRNKNVSNNLKKAILHEIYNNHMGIPQYY